ncbi:hypothetical protein GARC_4140 [Paraglaciecola arctica BSs20135]|uniref:Uncharacterized protein n=1 Tax=Paraglaciecola arctica BSs20135 TaxID=493475 RepID=K6YSD2_9ALTE|nr:hypothetical protein GARC_4140 [Paraglaciecola arctica BSs20135]
MPWEISKCPVTGTTSSFLLACRNFQASRYPGIENLRHSNSLKHRGLFVIELDLIKEGLAQTTNFLGANSLQIKSSVGFFPKRIAASICCSTISIWLSDSTNSMANLGYFFRITGNKGTNFFCPKEVQAATLRLPIGSLDRSKARSPACINVATSPSTCLK